MKIDNNLKNSTLKKILGSSEFKEADIYQKLLTYLNECSLHKNIPKEIIIAIEVFGKDASFNLNKDATVRYHIHTLRKKLEKYYKNEGKQDKIRISIPKGHYAIEYFLSRDSTRQIFSRVIKYASHWEIIAIILLVTFNIVTLFQLFKLNKEALKSNRIHVHDSIWSPFFENEYSTLIILGDNFLMDEYRSDLNRYRIIRDWEIDSEYDLEQFLNQYPNQKLKKSEITQIPFRGVDNFLDIIRVLFQFNQEINHRLSFSISLEDIKDHNFIYIGEFKNLRVLKQILYRTPIRFQYHPDERIHIVINEKDTLHTFYRIEAPYDKIDKFNIDYSVLIKMPGFNQEHFMFIVGFGYGGRVERTKMLCNPERLKEFEQNIKAINNYIPEYFIVVFEVQSIERTGFTNEIKYFKDLSALPLSN